METEIFTEIERDWESDFGISNLLICQSANDEEHWVIWLTVDAALTMMINWCTICF